MKRDRPVHQTTAEPRAERVPITGIGVEDGAPAEGAIVTAISRIEGEDVQVVAKSGPDGRFALDIYGRGYLTLSAVKDDRAHGAAEVWWLRGLPPEARIELRPAARVTVTVT